MQSSRLKPGILSTSFPRIWRGQRDLINALPAILSEHEGVHKVIIGEGEFRPQLEQEIDQLKLQDKITLTGFQAEERIAKWLNAADVFVFPSLREGTPNALLEAMACRVPCLISSIPENIELIQNPEQHFPPDQPEILAEKINNLMENQEYYDELLSTTLVDKQWFVFDWREEMVKVAEEKMNLKYQNKYVKSTY